MSSTLPPLPADLDHQAYVVVRPIIAGSLHIPLNIVFEDSLDEPDSNSVHIPTFSFLITHPTHGHMLFDLGVRKVREAYRDEYILAQTCPTIRVELRGIPAEATWTYSLVFQDRLQ